MTNYFNSVEKDTNFLKHILAVYGNGFNSNHYTNLQYVSLRIVEYKSIAKIYLMGNSDAIHGNVEQAKIGLQECLFICMNIQEQITDGVYTDNNITNLISSLITVIMDTINKVKHAFLDMPKPIYSIIN